MVLGDWGPNGRADIKTSLTFCLWDMSAFTLPSWVEDVYCKKTLDINPNQLPPARCAGDNPGTDCAAEETHVTNTGSVAPGV